MITVGNCYEILAGMAGGSVDAVVTDPPYGLSFMGKEWDHSVPSAAVWREVLRVLKPGGHLLAFAGTRTQHRMACNIEDAGFEIRDMLAWVYGSGFPKSLDVSKAIDKAAGVKGEYGAPKSSAHAGWIDRGRMRGQEGHEGYQRPWMEDADAVERNARQYIGGTVESRQWQGWGTALKPALEPITLARKPLSGTVAANVLEHGTGAINVDGCRVGFASEADEAESKGKNKHADFGTEAGGNDVYGDYSMVPRKNYNPPGRWPANLIHDGSEEVTDLLGTAQRFFYCPKASRKERGEGNNHPTVKPVELMRYLVRLVTPPGGLVLDPFCGSGTTGIACKLEGFAFHGIELNPEYAALAEQRISAALS